MIRRNLSQKSFASYFQKMRIMEGILKMVMSGRSHNCSKSKQLYCHQVSILNITITLLGYWFNNIYHAYISAIWYGRTEEGGVLNIQHWPFNMSARAGHQHSHLMHIEGAQHGTGWWWGSEWCCGPQKMSHVLAACCQGGGGLCNSMEESQLPSHQHGGFHSNVRALQMMSQRW